MSRLKTFFLLPLIVIGFIIGGGIAYGAEKSFSLIKKHLPFKASIQTATVIPTKTPTQTPTLTPVHTETPTPTVGIAEATPTLSLTPAPAPATPSATLTTTPQPESDKKLSIQTFDPPFLWADYATVGPQEALITGTGFTEGTVVELLGPHDPYETISTNDIIYPMTVITVLSSQQLKVKIPAGLYNAHYSIRITNPDKTYVERDSILVVSDTTQDTKN